MKNNDDFFGTMFDFNGDGHSDMTETFMAYQMMNEDDDSFVPKSGETRASSSGSGLTAVAVIIIVLVLLGWLFGGCAKHTEQSSSSRSSTASRTQSSAYTYRSKAESSTVQPVTKKSTHKSYSPKSSKIEDEFSAKDYVDADDFYYDHYDDFYDYEDAEDYYNEHADQ